MTTAMLDDASKLMQAAELLRLSADEMHDRRMAALQAGDMTAKSFRANVVSESELRTQVGEIVLKALTKVVTGATEAQDDLEAAITDANATIQKIDDVKHALEVFASLIALATAIATMKPDPIVQALKNVKQTVAA